MGYEPMKMVLMFTKIMLTKIYNGYPLNLHISLDQAAPYDRQTLTHEWFSLVEYQTTVNKNIL
jgi:hypothetical protein